MCVRSWSDPHPFHPGIDIRIPALRGPIEKTGCCPLNAICHEIDDGIEFLDKGLEIADKILLKDDMNQSSGTGQT
jgi:hypothetical protein